MKWEYRIELSQISSSSLSEQSFKDVHRITSSMFRKLGTDGWELVSVDNGIAYFKRPLRSRSEDEIMKHFENRSSLV